MLIDGGWTGGTSEVRSPYDGSVLGTVATAGPEDVDRAVRAAAAALQRDDFDRPARIAVLEAAARALAGQVEDFARTIAGEAAKPLRTARVEAQRAVDTFAQAAAVARTFTGEVVPLDATVAGRGRT